LTSFALAASARAGDWPSWRGPAQDGVSLETRLPSSTKDVLWRIPYGGRSTPVILDGRVFCIDLAGKGVHEQERVFAVNLADGKLAWEYRFNCFHTDIPDTRVGWASLAVDPQTGYVYANGVQGTFLCLDRDGRLIWSKSLTELFGRISGFGGRTHTPLLDEDRVIISFNNSSFGAHAIGSQRYLAMDKRTGEIVWWGAPGGRPEDSTYSNPIVTVIDGRRLILGGNADGGVYAMQARTGQRVWGFKLSRRGMNASPVADGYRVYAMHGDENFDSTLMGRVVCIDGRGTGDITKTGELWRYDGIGAGYTAPLLHGGRLYVMTNAGVLYAFDALTGKKYWEFNAGRIGKGSPVWGDGRIYLTTANGTFVILEDQGPRCRQLDAVSFNVGRGGNVELFGSPAIADGRVVFFTTTELICLGRKDAGPQKVPPVGLAAEGPADSQPASVLVRPAEVLLEPGQTVDFRAIAYDAQGRLIKPVAAQWSYGGKGSVIDNNGRFQAGRKGSIGEVTAQAGNLRGTARVRLVPRLPIVEDFESYKDGDVVGWWIGCSKTKYAVETRDGSKVLKKISDDRGPIFNRSHVFITPPLPPGYTVEADLLGVKQGRRRGDVGLINDGYDLELIGGMQRVRVYSWIPAPRFEKKIDFHWDPNRWYRAKLKVDVSGDEGHVYAKVWPRDEAEPGAWTLEAVDPQPNREGAAGIYANSTMAPLYYDNVKISR
jgi:outer membrane protein assembly factor BamB